MKFEKVKLGDICDFMYGKSLKKETRIETGPYPVYGSNGVVGYHDNYLSNEPTIIVGRKGSIGTVFLSHQPCWTIDTAYYLKPSIKLNLKFLYYQLRTLRLNELNKSAAIPGLNRNDAYGKMIVLPPLDIQQQIADTLDKADALCHKDQQLLQKYDELAQSIFHDMFGNPIHNSHHLKVRPLVSFVKKKSDLVDGPFGSSVNVKVDYVENGEIPVVRTKNVGLLKFKEDDLMFMKRETFEKVSRSQVLPGDIILTKVGTIGNVCLFPLHLKEGVLSTTGSCRLRTHDNIINRKFLLYHLLYQRALLNSMAAEGVQPFLNMTHIKSIPVLDTPLKLQKNFEKQIGLVEDVISFTCNGLKQSEKIFNSILNTHFS